VFRAVGFVARETRRAVQCTNRSAPKACWIRIGARTRTRLARGIACARGFRAVIVGPRFTSFGVWVVEKDLLLTIAEVSVALAGFSAIVGLLGNRSGRSGIKVDALRLQVMLEISLSVAAAAFLPVLISLFNFEVWTTWRIATALWLAIAIPSEIIAWFRTREMPDMKLDRLNVNTINWALCLLSDAVMFIVMIGFFEARAGALYMLALFVYLSSAAILFVQFAASTFMPSDP